MSDIETVTLDGGEFKVEGLNGQNTIIVNRGSATLYVSIYPDIVPDGDNVAAIPAGGAMNLLGTNGTLYLLGTGKVQLTGTDNAWLPISSGGSGGDSTGGGVSQAYVDNADASTLHSAKAYTDTETAKITKTITALETDKVNKAEVEAAVESAVEQAKEYSDNAQIYHFSVGNNDGALWNKLAECTLSLTDTDRWISVVFLLDKLYEDTSMNTTDSTWHINIRQLSDLSNSQNSILLWSNNATPNTDYSQLVLAYKDAPIHTLTIQSNNLPDRPIGDF